MISTRILNNGIRIVMEEMQHVNSCACGVWVRTGACDEIEKYSGISHFVEHMMFKGTPSRDAFRISYDVDRIGAQMNAFTGVEATCYYVKSTCENKYKAFDVIIDMLEHSLFDTAEMNRERKVIGEEIKMNADDPENVAHEELVTGLMKGTGIANSILGTKTSIGRVNHDVMRKYVDDQYVRDAITVSVAGRFDPDEICEYFENNLNELKADKPPRKVEKADKRIFYKSFVRDINQTHINMGTKCIDLKDDRNYTMQILNNILGGSMSSRLFQNIREKKGLAYTVFSSAGASTNDGYFEIYAGISRENLRKALSGIRDELSRFADETVTEDELEASREQMKATYVFSQESTSARMLVNGKNYLLLDKVFDPKEVMEGYDSVTPKAIDDLKSMICDFDDYSFVTVSGSRIDLKGAVSSVKGAAR